MGDVNVPGWNATHKVAEASIANLALARIGADLIRDTTDDTPSARQSKAVFAATRDELLRDYEFNFAQRYVMLSKADTYTGPRGHWQYAYEIPASPVVLKVLEVGGNKENLFEVIGSDSLRLLLCNIATTTTPTLAVKYVESVIDPARWDSLFKDALVLRLASKMAIPLVKRADLAQFLQGEFAAIFNLAKVASSKERQVDEAEPQWTDRTQQRQ
jgi:hypothetical protein